MKGLCYHCLDFKDVFKNNEDNQFTCDACFRKTHSRKNDINKEISWKPTLQNLKQSLEKKWN